MIQIGGPAFLEKIAVEYWEISALKSRWIPLKNSLIDCNCLLHQEFAIRQLISFVSDRVSCQNQEIEGKTFFFVTLYKLNWRLVDHEQSASSSTFGSKCNQLFEAEGKLTMNFVPLPTSLSKVTVPPIASVKRLTTANPKP